MEEIDLIELQNKDRFIGVKISQCEREMIDKFCSKNEISISDLVRYAIRKVVNEKPGK